jgi:crotonobetainyl-CoA:carnitine CoA-transferase CaiB-like acyl-CoA transferase
MPRIITAKASVKPSTATRWNEKPVESVIKGESGITNPFQKKAYEAVAAALPFAIDPSKITVEPGLSYIRSPIKVHDYAAGLMAAFGSVVERLGTMRGLPAQTMKLNRRLCGLRLNDLQLLFLNGYSTLVDNWGIGPDNGTYRARDGRHVTMIGLHPRLRDGLLDYFQCANSTAAIQKAVEQKTAQQLEDELAALNLPLGMVRSPQEWLANPQGEATAKRTMIDIERKGDARKRVLGKAKYRPLEGVRVMEFTQVVAGPQCGMLLAEQGADVIKVQPPLGNVVYPIWISMSWGKKNILLDIKSSSGKQRFAELLAGADVLIDSNRPGALTRLGFDEGTLRKLNPNLVYAKMSLSPPSTPWANRKGFEQIAQAASGAMHVHSEGLPEPQVVPALLNDALTAYLLATGVVAALAEREEKGGYWDTGAYLSRCSTMACNFAEPQGAEEYAPVNLQDFIDHGVDQVAPWGTFTRFAPPVAFSHSPSFAARPTSWPGMDPDTTGWTEDPVGEGPPKVPHYPSKLAREGGIRNLLPTYGIQDRGDGQSGLGLASKEIPEPEKSLIMKYFEAHQR